MRKGIFIVFAVLSKSDLRTTDSERKKKNSLCEVGASTLETKRKFNYTHNEEWLPLTKSIISAQSNTSPLNVINEQKSMTLSLLGVICLGTFIIGTLALFTWSRSTSQEL